MKTGLCLCVSLAVLGGAIGACSMSQTDGALSMGDPDQSSGSGFGSSASSGSGGLYQPPDVPPFAPPPTEELACDDLDQSKPTVLYLSADDSNSMGSPALAREFIQSGLSLSEHWGLQSQIRTYEFLNYYPINYPAPNSGIAVYPQMAAGDEEGLFDMQIGVRSADAETRRPMTLTFVADTSGSMSGEPIQRERAVIRAIAKSLSEGDIVNMVTWSTTNAVVLDGHVVTGADDAVLIDKANGMTPGGGTDLNGGLKAGYMLAQKHYGAARLNRVILISDGGANAGVTDQNLIGNNSKDADQEGIYLVGVGTGPASGYHDDLMDVVTDKGRGAYVYIDSVEEAEEMFVARFDEVMEIAARAVQVEMTLPWYFQMHKFYGEEYSTDPTEVDPQHLAPGDAMIINQVLKACDASLVQGSDEIQVKVSWQDPVTYLSKSTSVTMTVDELLNGNKEQLYKGKAIVAYAEALKDGSQSALTEALDAIDQAGGGNDAFLSEIASLIQQHPAF